MNTTTEHPSDLGFGSLGAERVDALKGLECYDKRIRYAVKGEHIHGGGITCDPDQLPEAIAYATQQYVRLARPSAFTVEQRRESLYQDATLAEAGEYVWAIITIKPWATVAVRNQDGSEAKVLLTAEPDASIPSGKYDITGNGFAEALREDIKPSLQPDGCLCYEVPHEDGTTQKWTRARTQAELAEAISRVVDDEWGPLDRDQYHEVTVYTRDRNDRRVEVGAVQMTGECSLLDIYIQPRNFDVHHVVTEEGIEFETAGGTFAEKMSAAGWR